MSLLSDLLNLLLHLDEHIQSMAAAYGAWTYLILFVIVFCETGLIITPFLPGDSLLFAAGALAAVASLQIEWLIILLIIAAILGDAVNYSIGKSIGPRAFSGSLPLLRQDHLRRTQEFYERYGAKTIILARFIPIVRTFAPFVAGVGSMRYTRFALFNVAGGVLWVLIFTLGGYYFGNIPVVKDNFTIVVLAIIAISVVPGVVELVKHKIVAKQRIESQQHDI